VVVGRNVEDKGELLIEAETVELSKDIIKG
jgi:hypothetical protein